MAEYGINKGIGRPAEFKGLKSQYLFIFAGGLLSIFIIFVVMYMAGVEQWMCIGFGVTMGLALVFFTFRLNAKYGTHGMMKVFARAKHPRRVRSEKSILRIFKTQSQW
jgi:type IV secretory pathway TrbD component